MLKKYAEIFGIFKILKIPFCSRYICTNLDQDSRFHLGFQVSSWDSRFSVSITIYTMYVYSDNDIMMLHMRERLLATVNATCVPVCNGVTVYESREEQNYIPQSHNHSLHAWSISIA